jgi:diguanylate cyclase (GGDEF)-like protein
MNQVLGVLADIKHGTVSRPLMIKPPLPLDETARLVSLHSLRILDTRPEHRFDRIVRMAKRIFGVEICLISLVDSHRQWFKAKEGLEACETSREISFCGHAILNEEVFVVNDARSDERFADNPLVTSAPFIRFYAGCPVHTAEGYRIGTLCLIDSQVREFSEDEKATLSDLAGMVEHEITVSSQVTIDELTQIANRRGFNVVAKHILSLCRRTNANVELAYFDLDNFKVINDAHGHAAGDEILKHFAKLLIKCFRSADVIARLGGDEFAVLLAGADESAAVALKRLTKMAADDDCPIKGKLNWSVGTTQYHAERHGSIEALVTDADARMYTDKTARRKACG